MPMGVKNGNAQFQRMMEWLLRDFPFADCYIDDIIIGSTGDTKQEILANHAKHVEDILLALEEHQLLAKLDEGSFFVRSVEFCGQVLENGTRCPKPGKLAAIQQWELPQTIKELRVFLGLCNYYAQYLRNYADTAGPMQDLLKLPTGKSKGAGARKLAWTDKSCQSFEDTKKLLDEGLSLFIMNLVAPFMSETDASDYAIGAVLHQFDTDGIRTGEKGKAFPVSFFSQKLPAGQVNWNPREKKCYAIVSAPHKWSD